MRARRAALSRCGLLVAFWLAGCSTAPIQMTPQFTAPQTRNWLGDGRTAPGQACRVEVTAVKDVRIDPGSLGRSGGRVVLVASSTDWVRSGLDSLNRDSRLRISETPTGGADLAIEVELVKAYTMNITTERSTNVVFRVRYTDRNGAKSEQIYRGAYEGGNWSNGEGETLDSFDSAMTELLTTLDRDIVAKCGKEQAPAP